MMASIQARLASGLVISLVALFLVLWLAISQAIRVLAEDYIASRLEHDATNLLAAISITPDGKLQLDEQRFDAVYHRPFSGHYYQISRPDQAQVYSRSLWDQTLTVPFIKTGQSQRLHRVGPQQQPLLIHVAGFNKQGVSLSVAVAEDISSLEADIEKFQTYFALTAAATLLLLIVIQFTIIRRSLHPLDKVCLEIKAVENGQLGQLSQQVPTEIKPLVVEINHLLSVLTQRLQRSRNTLGDLAHALKTPLTLLRRLAEDNNTTQTDLKETQQNLLTQTNTMQGLMERALRRARLAGDGLPGARFAVQDDSQALINTLQQMYRDKEFILQLGRDAGKTVVLDREDMLELLGNLLDNAGKWARHKVIFSIQVDQALHCEIEDDGPGVSDEQLKLLTQRGLRLDEANEGYGLGLAIVRDIIEQYRGEIRFTASEKLGGLKITLNIPLSSAAL